MTDDSYELNRVTPTLAEKIAWPAWSDLPEDGTVTVDEWLDVANIVGWL